MEKQAIIQCFSCGAAVPDIEGEVHEYILAAPGCWQLYGEVLAKDYGEFGYPEVHQMTVDAYAVQHPGKPERRAIQSVTVHLISLYYAIEKGLDASQSRQMIGQALRFKQAFTWLEPPKDMGKITVADVARRANSLQEYEQAVRAWAASAWQAWSAHHPQIRAWAERIE